MFKFFRRTCLYLLAIPLLFTFLGAASNQLVLNANHDTFPVRINLVKAHKFADDAVVLPDGTVMLDETHCIMSDKTHLNLLADVLDFNREGIYSVGDLLLELGDWSWNFAPFLFGFAVIGKLNKQD
jgi:Family of unknown function (DUF5317)